LELALSGYIFSVIIASLYSKNISNLCSVGADILFKTDSQFNLLFRTTLEKMEIICAGFPKTGSKTLSGKLYY
jgi:hypothetical protein